MHFRRFAVVASLAILAFSRFAGATNVTEFPDNGSEQMQRGGAWIARASDPLASFYNPAGLAGQRTAVTLQSNITFGHTCFTRRRAAGDSTQDFLVDANGSFPRVCNDVEPIINPQLGATFRVNERIGIGLLLLAPSSAANATWPEFVPDASGRLQPAPQRYLLLKANSILTTLSPGIGIEPIDGLRIGVAFQWSALWRMRASTAVSALNADNQNPRINDVKADLDLKNPFIPGFTAGAIYSLTDNIDLAGWYRWSGPIVGRGDVTLQTTYFTSQVAAGNTNGVTVTDSSLSNCGINGGENKCGNGDNVRLKIPVPMEAKLGVRYHQPRAGGEIDRHRRDPLADDQFDVELNLTWANNSALDAIEVRLPGDQNGNGIIPVNGVSGGVLPPNVDQPRNYRDVFGARLGGDYNIVPGRWALRGGVFIESSALDPKNQNIDIAASERFGFALGSTYRVPIADTGALEFSLGYGHVFFGTQQNNDPNAKGMQGVTGAPCNPGESPPGNTCSTGNQKYRTNWPVNLGTITNSINVINVGAAYRF